MDLKLELVVIPVSDVDRAKTFYNEKVGFSEDVDTRVSDEMRVVQLTPRDRRARSASGRVSRTQRRVPFVDCTWSSPTSRPRAPSLSNAEWMSARSGISSRAHGCQAQIPNAPTTARTLISATPTATPGSCRRSGEVISQARQWRRR